MKDTRPKILIVDDDNLNLDVLVECLKDESFVIVQACDGNQALNILRESPEPFQAVVLDRLMPGMDGLEVMAELKNDDRFKWIPVVMQTSAALPTDICEGMEAGVFFYLTKPYSPEVLIRIVRAAVEEGLKWKTIAHNITKNNQSLNFLKQGQFQVQTMEECFDLAMVLGHLCPDPEKAAFGLNELMANAVEHGNLGIGFHEKTELQLADRWEEEIERRLALVENSHKVVDVFWEKEETQIRITIVDQGEGFDWREFEEIRADRLLESHGRGIAMAKNLSFDSLEYQGNGNRVICLIQLPRCALIGAGSGIGDTGNTCGSSPH